MGDVPPLFDLGFNILTCFRAIDYLGIMTRPWNSKRLSAAVEMSRNAHTARIDTRRVRPCAGPRLARPVTPTIFRPLLWEAKVRVQSIHRRDTSAMTSDGMLPFQGNYHGVMFTLNHRSFHEMRAVFTIGFLICGALSALALPNQARAQFSGDASAIGRYESNSNVFAAPSGGVRFSDMDYSYGVDFNGRYQFGRQEVHASVGAEEDGYQRNTQLNHNSYNVDAGLNWELGSNLDGAFDVTRSHTMVPFYDLTGSAATGQTPLSLSVATTQSETANIGYQFYSAWKVTASASNVKTDQPIPNAPNLELTQSSGATSIQYTSLNGLTGGFQAGYTSGNYNAAVAVNGTDTPAANPSFSQESAAFLANYKFKRTSFDGQLGYSRRTSDTAANDSSGVTGLLAFTDQLTPKTSLRLQGDRVINSYLLNAGSEIDTDAIAGVTWQATFKISVYAGYTYTYRQFPGQGNNPVGSDRVDAQQSANLAVSYDPRSWLSIRTYANLTLRNSNFIGGHFDQNIFGITVTVTPYRVKPKLQPKR